MFRTRLFLCAITMTSYSLPISAQSSGSAAKPATAAGQHDGQHDFDFEDGIWKIHLKRLDHPLTGSNNWIEFDGTSTTKQLWDGAAHLEQFETVGSSGKVQGITFRLYRPESHQWYIYWVNRKDGALGQPMIGEFNSGVGEFYDQEPFNGKMILVRYIWSNLTTAPHFEQAFSDDGGKTWEVNWITDQTRVGDQPAKGH
jgi:hypothetical protein